jgi:hypothetical protein
MIDDWGLEEGRTGNAECGMGSHITIVKNLDTEITVVPWSARNDDTFGSNLMSSSLETRYFASPLTARLNYEVVIFVTTDIYSSGK